MARMKEGEVVGGGHEEGDAGRGRSCSDFSHCSLPTTSAFTCNWRCGENHGEKKPGMKRGIWGTGHVFLPESG
jgi:hypothetical protein